MIKKQAYKLMRLVRQINIKICLFVFINTY
jgi:hypothetical protein